MFMGVDVGAVSTNLAVIDDSGIVVAKVYLRTLGNPIESVQRGMREIAAKLGDACRIRGVGATGSARHLAGVLVGGDCVTNEITAHAVASMQVCPDVRTVIEIGGQDSKIIIIADEVVVDFAMNTVCAAGTGAFLDHQAARLGVPIEEFGALALKSGSPVRIAGRCTVFAESDMIHKQQIGQSREDIINGLCEALVRNYLSNVAKGKDIETPIMFQGGVAANMGIKNAFEKHLGKPVLVPEHFDVMGAIGMALLAKETVPEAGVTRFRGFAMSEMNFITTGFECDGCPNMCEVVEALLDGELITRWGDRCGKWQDLAVGSANPQKA